MSWVRKVDGAMKGKEKKKSESNLAKSSTNRSLCRGLGRGQNKQSLGGADKASRAINSRPASEQQEA